jgi:hypothetical protein
VYNNFSSNTRAIGGFFFGSDQQGQFESGTTISITAVDGSQTLTRSLMTTTTTTFFGVISDGTITSFTVTFAGVPSGQLAAFPTVNDVILGAPAATAVPAPPTWVLGVVGVGCAVVARLRRWGR